MTCGGGAGHSAAENAPVSAAPAMQGRDPEHHHGGVHEQISPDQCGLRFGPLEDDSPIAKMAPSCRLYVSQASHKDNGSDLSSPGFEATQLSLSTYRDQVSVCK